MSAQGTKKTSNFRCSFSKTLCGQRDSNPHASRHQILSLTWLPITPCPQDLASESLLRAIICGAKIYTFYNICNFICDFLENFSYNRRNRGAYSIEVVNKCLQSTAYIGLCIVLSRSEFVERGGWLRLLKSLTFKSVLAC